MAHAERRKWCEEILKINTQINEETKKKLDG
jgi:hypothetical protein